MTSRRTPAFEKLLFAFGWVGLAFLVVPVLMIFPLSLDPGNALRFPPSGISVRWYQAYLASRPWLHSTLLSLEIAFYASMIAAVLGSGAAITMSRGHIRGAAAWSFLLISPMLVPHIVLAVAMYSVFSSLGLAGSKIGLALAHGVLGLPFVILNVASSLRGLPKDTENAAMSMGARPVAVLLEITVPLIWRGILAGAIFAFVVSFDEVVISMFLSSSASPTLPKRMLDGIFFDLSPILAAVSASLVVFNVALSDARIRRCNPLTQEI